VKAGLSRSPGSQTAAMAAPSSSVVRSTARQGCTAAPSACANAATASSALTCYEHERESMRFRAWS
jgi:hypothetical protein